MAAPEPPAASANGWQVADGTPSYDASKSLSSEAAGMSLRRLTLRAWMRWEQRRATESDLRPSLAGATRRVRYLHGFTVTSRVEWGSLVLCPMRRSKCMGIPTSLGDWMAAPSTALAA